VGEPLLIVQNAGFEGPGYLLDWARDEGFDVAHCRAWEQGLPEAPGHVIVLGAPESVRDLPKIEWLGREAEWLRKLLAGEARVLGICLGAQLVAHVLGGEVKDGAHAEIGWHPLEAFGERFPLFQWHKEVFTLPPGAEAFARSEATALQGFRWRDRVWALAGHPEVTPELAREFARLCWSEECAGGRFVQRPELIEREGERRFSEARPYVRKILNRWARG
jgi:GMP synthase-like glutamine amidotransferase